MDVEWWGFFVPGGGRAASSVGAGRWGSAPEVLTGAICRLPPQFSSLQKEIEERTNDIELLKSEQMKLQGIIRSLEKDIQGLKREIQERDETIQDKVRATHCPARPLPRGTQSWKGSGFSDIIYLTWWQKNCSAHCAFGMELMSANTALSVTPTTRGCIS